MSLPLPLHKFFSYFPLHTWPPVKLPRHSTPSTPTLWIQPPRSLDGDVLSSDVESLKWQAYLALRGLTGISIRWDVSAEGAIDGRLPSLQLGETGQQLLASHMIPAWVDETLQVRQNDELEGYKDQHARDESRAWVTLMEGSVQAALLLSQSKPVTLRSLLLPTTPTRQISAVLSPPPAPLSGLSSLLPPYGTHIHAFTVEQKYREAITALSERLGTDKWFLGSENPTALDALVFAYLHCLLHARDYIRIEVTRRVNLVAWELRVQSQVQAAFQIMDFHLRTY